MQAISRLVKISIKLLLIITLTFAISACGISNLSGNEPLPTVSSLPLPQLPDWIEQISPTGETETLAQIRIRFKEALIPVETIDSPQQQNLLKKFEVIPPLPGQFRFLTPRMVGFQADKALPKATRVRVTLKAGLADLKNHRLAQDLAWTFNTEPIKLTNLPTIEYNSEPIGLKPTLNFNSNVELDLASLEQHLTLVPEQKKATIPLRVAQKKEDQFEEEQQSQELFEPGTRDFSYSITPQRILEKATNYRLEFSPGLRPARGNLQTETAFGGQVKTYTPLKFDKLDLIGKPDVGGTFGRFVKGSPQLLFNNRLAAESAKENITVNPAPKKAPQLVQTYEGSNSVNLNPYALEPAKDYTITIGANLQDQFGQTLGKSIKLKYNTGDLAGDIWVPSGFNIFPSGTNVQLNISTVNLPESKYKAAYRVMQPADVVNNYSLYATGEGKDLLPSSDQWQSYKISGKKNQNLEISVPLREKLGANTGMLAYGVQARTNTYKDDTSKQQWREFTAVGMVELTNLGVFAQWFPESGLVKVNHLSDGAAVAGATVEIYESKESKSRTKPQPCAIAQTDKTGTVLLSRQDLRSCMQGGTSFVQAPSLIAIARVGKDWAFARTHEYSGAYEYGIDAGWQSSEPESRGTIFSDRQLYQPGETAGFTGLAYYLQNGKLTQDKNVRYTVTLENPEGKTTNLGTQTTNDFGTFSLELPIKPNQPLGYYLIRAKRADGGEISGEFRIAEFKPPNFKVALTLDQQFAVSDQKISAQVQSNYLFGPAVESGKAQYYVTRQQTDFTPKGWEKFTFGRKWFWPEESPSVTTDVLQANQVLDKQGASSQIIPIAKDLPYPMTYRVDAQITDVSNLSVSNSATFTALPSNRLIGLQTDFVTDADKPFPVQIIVTDPTGKVIEGEKVRLELQKMDISSVTQVVEGSQTAKNQVEYKTVKQVEIRSTATPQSISLTPPEAGSYRIQANFANSKDELTATDWQIWAMGDSPVYWGERYQNNRLDIKLDKDSYQPGETATALIQSPYPEAELHFAVVRHNILHQQIVKVKGGAPLLKFQVTPDMLPNAAVEAVLVRQGVPLSKLESGSLDKLVKIGFAPFKTNLDNKYLQVQVTPRQTSLQPGAEQTVQLQLKDIQGNPVEGQFTVMVVNEAVLQLSGYRLPDLVKTVYAEQAISTRLADNRPDVVLETLSSPLDKGWGYGGGLSAGAASTRVRTEFKPLAYYNGSVLTDASGKAEVKFKLPDDLTTWRVMVAATDGNLRFGNSDATFITTKALLSNPVLPQFVRPGDRISAGLSVTNTTGQAGTLTIDGKVNGSLQFAARSQTQLQTPAESGTRAYRFPIVAARAGKAEVEFITRLNNVADAFKVPLDVKALEVTEQVVETGTTTKQVKIPLNIDKNVVADVGGLDISLASTLIPEIIAPARQGLAENELPFLESAASQLAIASNLALLSQKYAQSFTQFNPTQQANQALAQLQKLQQPDGGFASWLGAEQSDPFVTAYAAQSLAKALGAGITVNPTMVNRLKTYLQKTLANPKNYTFCNEVRCRYQIRLEALIAIAQLGEKRNDFLADIYELRSESDLVTQIKLANYLSQFPEWQQESKTLFNQLQETIYETGRSARVNLPQGWDWLNSATTAQAEAIRLFIAQKSKPEVIDRLLQGLLNLRRDGTWINSYDNAQALTALVEYSQLQPTPPNFTATVQLAGKKLGAAKFEGYSKPSLEVKRAIAQLPHGRNEIILQKSGQGTLHYLVAYRYRLPGNQPGKLNGLRVVREIRPANQETVLRRLGLYAPEEPLTVGSGQVFDIGLQIITDHRVDHVLITDPLPAGFEAVDSSFQTSTPYFQAQGDSWEIDYQRIHRDRIVAYANSLTPGVYTLHYLVRSVTPGTYLWLGAEAHLKYAPEEFGRSASSVLEVSQP